MKYVMDNYQCIIKQDPYENDDRTSIEMLEDEEQTGFRNKEKTPLLKGMLVSFNGNGGAVILKHLSGKYSVCGCYINDFYDSLFPISYNAN